MTIFNETNMKGVSLLRTARICAERDHKLAREMVAAANGLSGLIGWRAMVSCGVALGESRERACRLASCARKIASFERPWWIVKGTHTPRLRNCATDQYTKFIELRATGGFCDGKEHIITGLYV